MSKRKGRARRGRAIPAEKRRTSLRKQRRSDSLNGRLDTPSGSNGSLANDPLPVQRLVLRRTWLWLPPLVGLALRVVHLRAVFAEPALHDFLLLDSAVYADMARSVLRGDLLIGREPFSMGPLYAYLLALLWRVSGLSNHVVIVVQTAVGLVSIVLVTLLARRVSSRLGACLAGLTFAAYAPTVMLETKLQGESFALCIVLLVTFMLSNARASGRRTPVLFASAALLGGACLLRPDLLLLVGLLATWLLVPSKLPLRQLRLDDLRFGRAGVWLACVTVVVSLATVRNYVVSGEPILISSQSGISFYQGNNPRAEGTYSPPVELSGDKVHQEREARAVAERELGKHLSYAEVDSYWFRRGLAYLFGNPGDAFELFARKLGLLVSSAELSGEYVVRAERCLAPSLRIAAVPFGLFLSAAVLGAARARRCDPALTRLLMLIAISGLLTGMAFFVASRYRLVAAAHLAVFVGSAWDTINGWLTSTKRLTLGRPLLGAAALVVSMIPWSDAERFQAAGELYNLGGLHYEHKHYEEAIRYYLAALKVRPKSQHLLYNLSQAYAVSGDYRAAAKHLNELLRLNPQELEARHYVEQYQTLATTRHNRKIALTPVCEL